LLDDVAVASSHQLEFNSFAISLFLTDPVVMNNEVKLKYRVSSSNPFHLYLTEGLYSKDQVLEYPELHSLLTQKIFLLGYILSHTLHTDTLHVRKVYFNALTAIES
jgi:hypothetical protein